MKENYKNLVSKGGVDLHCHTNISDGKYTIYEVLDMACEQGLSAIAITDHNMMHNDIEEIQKIYAAKGLHVIKGTEISALYEVSPSQSIEVHVVALQVNEEKLEHIFQNYLNGRKAYTEAMLNRLREEHVADISYEELQERFQNNFLGKKHVAQFLTEMHVTSSISEALDKYVGSLGEKRCIAYSKDYIKLPKLSEVVEAILKAGGIPILAHPYYYTSLSEAQLEELIFYFKKLAGSKAAMEVYYYDYNKEQTENLKRFAEKYSLAVSGGGDFHGWNQEEKIMQFDLDIKILLNAC